MRIEEKKRITKRKRNTVEEARFRRRICIGKRWNEKKKKEAKKKRKRMQMPMKEAYTVGRSVLCVHTYQTSFCVYVCSQMKSEVVWREPKNNARVVLHTTLVVFKPRTDASFFPSLTKKKKRFKKIKRKMCSRACNIRWWRLIVFLYVKKERKMKRYSKKRKKKGRKRARTSESVKLKERERSGNEKQIIERHAKNEQQRTNERIYGPSRLNERAIDEKTRQNDCTCAWVCVHGRVNKRKRSRACKKWERYEKVWLNPKKKGSCATLG